MTGTLTHNSATGAKTYTGDVTINTGGNWNGTGRCGDILWRQFAEQRDFYRPGGCSHLHRPSRRFGGTLSIASVTVNGTYQNSGTLTVGTALTGSGTLTQGASATLNLGGTSTITTLTATANPNTVNYNGAAQTVLPVAYYHLTLSGSGAKTMIGVTTIGGNLTLSGSATMTGNAGFTVTGALNYGSSGSTALTGSTPVSIGTFSQTAGTLVDNGNTITVTGTGAGVWTTNNVGTFTATGTVLLTGAAPQIGPGNFRNLTINVGSGNTATMAGALTTVGTLTISAGTTLADGGFTDTVNGDVANAGTHSSSSAGKILLTGGAGAHTLSGSGAYGNVQLNDANGATLTGSRWRRSMHIPIRPRTGEGMGACATGE